MSLSLSIGPATEPISLAEAKLQCRVDTPDEDELIATLVVAARQHVESFTHRALITQTWDLKLDAFPCGEIVLPKAPCSAVTSITYLDTTGASQTWSSSYYRTSLPAGDLASPGRITPAYAVPYPPTYRVIDAVTVRFVAGYGAAAAVPAALKAAIKILIAHWYQTREPILTDRRMESVPLSVESLLWPYKSF